MKKNKCCVFVQKKNLVFFHPGTLFLFYFARSIPCLFDFLTYFLPMAELKE